jgi:hypothetical protein
MVRTPSGPTRSTFQKPDSVAPVQVVKTPALVQRHHSPFICYTVDEGTTGQRSDDTER